jgi:glucose-6-phosphate 1-dehydrogenase
MPEETHRSGSLYGGTADPCAVILFGVSGTWGPRESDQLLEREARQWYNP